MEVFLLLIGLVFIAVFSLKRAAKLAKDRGGWANKGFVPPDKFATTSPNISVNSKPNKPQTTTINTKYTCPICSDKHEIEFIRTHRAPFDYTYRDEATIIKKTHCANCKHPITLVVFKSGSVKAYNDEWESEKKEARKPLIAAENEHEKAEWNLDELECEIEDLKEDIAYLKNNAEQKRQLKDKKSQLPDLKKKLKEAISTEAKEERKFERLEDKYYEKIDRILEKLDK